MFYCYLYRDPTRNNEPIYVGKGHDRRAYGHLTRTHNRHLKNRIKLIERLGSQPVIDFLCKDVDEELAFLCEVEAISKFGRRDLQTGSLLNLTDGGDGPKGVVRPPMCISQKQLISQSRIGQRISEQTKTKMRKPRGPRKVMGEHTGGSPKKRCTVDGKTFFDSLSELRKVLGQGKNGTRNPNLCVVSE